MPGPECTCAWTRLNRGRGNCYLDCQPSDPIVHDLPQQVTNALAFFGEAWGSGFQIRENSASALGNAFAGAAASSEDPSIIANNPAGMIGLSGNQVSGATSAS